MNITENALIEGIATQFCVPEAVALSWLTSFAQRFDPKAASERLANRYVGWNPVVASAREDAERKALQCARSPQW